MIDIDKIAYNKNYDLWKFLEVAYNKNIKLDLGHFIILNLLIGINKLYEELSKKYGEETAREILEKNHIFIKNTDYISGEFLKRYIKRNSRVAVHNRIKDLKNLGFCICSKSGKFGGYKLIKCPEWFNSL